jgi:hypothetical protein
MLIRNIKFNLGNLENLNKIKVQTSMANGHFGITYIRNVIKNGFFLLVVYIFIGQTMSGIV